MNIHFEYQTIEQKEFRCLCFLQFPSKILTFYHNSEVTQCSVGFNKWRMIFFFTRFPENLSILKKQSLSKFVLNSQINALDQGPPHWACSFLKWNFYLVERNHGPLRYCKSEKYVKNNDLTKTNTEKFLFHQLVLLLDICFRLSEYEKQS